MSAQQVREPNYRLRALSAVALLVVVLAIGAVTAVNLFPTAASGQATDATKALVEFRAGERTSLSQTSDERNALIEFRAGERASLSQAAGE